MKYGWREGNQIQLLENGDQFYPPSLTPLNRRSKNNPRDLYLV